MLSSLSLALVATVLGTLATPAMVTPSSSTPSSEWLLELRGQIEGIVQAINQLNEVFATSLSGWWRELLPQVAHELGGVELQPELETLGTMIAQLPADSSIWLRALYHRLLAQTKRVPAPESTTDSFRTVVALDPRFREAERQSIARQANTATLLGLSDMVQNATDKVAAELARSPAAVNAANLAMRDAESLQVRVAGAQSSRALLQYLGEGLADLMRQNASSGGIVSQQLGALSQQEALATRDLQIMASFLAQDIIVREQERRGQAAARAEALRMLAEGYSHSLIMVGSSLLDLEGGIQLRRRQIIDAITPAR